MWKVMGPDRNGSYGGLQGVGGLESTIREADGLTVPVINDYYGDVVGTINSQSCAVSWSSNQVSGYGLVLGYEASTLSLGTPLAESLTWRSRRIDPTGYYYMGARYYDPVAGHFISPDPLGHASCADLYSAFNGDPVNCFDPSGRVVIQQWQAHQQALLSQGGLWNNIQAFGISTKYAALSLFSLGSFNKNDRLADLNLEGSISDAQFYGGMTVNAAVASASLYTGGAAGTFVAARLVKAGASPLVTMLGGGAASGFTAGVTDVAGTRIGYAATGNPYEQTAGQDLTSIGISTATGTGFGALTYAGMRGNGVIYYRTDANGSVKPYYGQAKNSDRFEVRQAKEGKEYPQADFDFEIINRGNAEGQDLRWLEQARITANGGARSQNPNTPLANKNRAMNDADFADYLQNAMQAPGLMGAFDNDSSVILSKH